MKALAKLQDPMKQLCKTQETPHEQTAPSLDYDAGSMSPHLNNNHNKQVKLDMRRTLHGTPHEATAPTKWKLMCECTLHETPHEATPATKPNLGCERTHHEALQEAAAPAQWDLN